MKRYAIAAAALLLGTSALAWAPDKMVEGKPLAAEKSDVKMADAQLKKADMDVVADAKPAWQPVYAEQANAFDDSWAPKAKSASYDGWQDDPAMQDSTPPADEPKWGAEPTVAFDGYGNAVGLPTSGGRIAIRSGDAQAIVTVDATTGEARVSR